MGIGFLQIILRLFPDFLFGPVNYAVRVNFGAGFNRHGDSLGNSRLGFAQGIVFVFLVRK